MWYAMHEEKPARAKGKKLLEPKVTLLRTISEFKAAVRKVMVFCCDTKDEHLFRACPSRQNRLIDLAIGNKQVAIQGMPCIPEDEAETIVADILSFKGMCSKNKKTYMLKATSELEVKRFSTRIVADTKKALWQKRDLD